MYLIIICSYTDSVSPCATSVCLSTYALVKSAVFINRTSLTEHSQQCFLNIDSMFISYTCVRDTLSEMATILCVLYYDILCGFLYNLHVQQETVLQVHYYIYLKS